jgi:hypothetical protein
MEKKKILSLGLTMVLMLPSASFAAPPTQLYGKSISISWTESRMQRIGSANDFAMANIPQTLNVYISSKGQYFSRRGASTRAGSGSFDAVGTNGQSHEGNARGVTFSGHAMNVSAALSSGARSISVQFDGGFGSCDANVIIGRNGGQNIKIKALVGGQTVEIKSATASGANCSIREGNVFTN